MNYVLQDYFQCVIYSKPQQGLPVRDNRHQGPSAALLQRACSSPSIFAMCQAPFTNPSSLSEKSITNFESNNNNGQIINAPPVSNHHQEAPTESQANEKKHSEADFNQSEMGVKPSSEKNDGDRVTELYSSSFIDKSVEQGCERPMSIGRLSTGKSTSESRETSQSKESSSSSRYV